MMKNSYEREKTKTEGNQPPKSDVETATPKMSDFREKRNGEQHKLTEKTLASLDTEKKGMPLNWDETETKVSEVTTYDSDIVSSKARTVSATAYCKRNDAFAKLEQILWGEGLGKKCGSKFIMGGLACRKARVVRKREIVTLICFRVYRKFSS